MFYNGPVSTIHGLEKETPKIWRNSKKKNSEDQTFVCLWGVYSGVIELLWYQSEMSEMTGDLYLVVFEYDDKYNSWNREMLR